MLLTLRHLLIASGAAAGGTFLLVLPLVLWRMISADTWSPADLIWLAATPLVSAASVAVVVAWAARRVRRPVEALTAQLTAVRHHPSRTNLSGGTLDDTQITRLGPLFTE